MRLRVPSLEVLETRRLLSGKSAPVVTFQETPATGGTTDLVIRGTPGNDNITINDSGTEAPGNIFVSAGGVDYMSTGAVSSISVITGSGTDKVTYELVGNLQPNYQELVSVAAGAKKGGGSLEFDADIIGKIYAGANLEIVGAPDQHEKTTMDANESGEVDGVLQFAKISLAKMKPRMGSQTINFNSTGAIGTAGELGANIFGTSASDNATFSYSGVNNGNLGINAVGGGGNDQLTANVYLVPGSKGTVGLPEYPSILQTSGKKDRISYSILQGTDSTSTTNIFASILDTSKKDISEHTANVAAKTKGKDSILGTI
jgi:hypothetical protein